MQEGYPPDTCYRTWTIQVRKKGINGEEEEAVEHRICFSYTIPNRRRLIIFLFLTLDCCLSSLPRLFQAALFATVEDQPSKKNSLFSKRPTEKYAR